MYFRALCHGYALNCPFVRHLSVTYDEKANFLCLSLFFYALLCVHSSFAIILKRKRKLVALLLLSYSCIVTVYVLWLSLMVPLVGLRCVIVVFPDHTHFLCYLYATAKKVKFMSVQINMKQDSYRIIK